MKDKARKKHVGILTCHEAHNFGSMLQAYALQKVVAELTGEAELIDYRNANVRRIFRIFKFSGKTLVEKILNSLLALIYLPKHLARQTSFRNFSQNFLKLSKKSFYNEDALKKHTFNYDAYIAGSDQIWNAELLGGLDNLYTLNFGDSYANRISYAASLGVSKIDPQHVQEYRKKLAGIDYISVREESARKEIEKILLRDVKVVLDPTFLIKRREWAGLIGKIRPEKEKYVLVYCFGDYPELTKIVDYISERIGLKVIHFELKKTYKDFLRSAYVCGPLEFLNLVKNAEYVVTNSFHGTVFSIIFNKNFFVVPHRRTGSRMICLMNKFGLGDRIVHTFEDFKMQGYSWEINYSKVNKILEKEREKSLKFLKKAIYS